MKSRKVDNLYANVMHQYGFDVVTCLIWDVKQTGERNQIFHCHHHSFYNAGRNKFVKVRLWLVCIDFYIFDFNLYPINIWYMWSTIKNGEKYVISYIIFSCHRPKYVRTLKSLSSSKKNSDMLWEAMQQAISIYPVHNFGFAFRINSFLCQQKH